MKKVKYQIIITAYNANNEVMLSKAQGTFGSNKRILYNSEEEANEEVSHLKELVNLPNMNGSYVKFEVKPA